MTTGDDLLRTLVTLGNPHRLRIIAALVERRFYVSELARELGISRPLLQMHLRRLEQAGLVSSTVEISDDGKAMKYYEATEFHLTLERASVAAAVKTLTVQSMVADEPAAEEPTRGRRRKGTP